MTVRSICFFRYHAGTGITGDLYVVPAGYTLLFKDVRVFNGGASANPMTVGARAQEASSSMPFFSQSVPASSAASQALWVVLRPGDTVTMTSGALDTWVWLSGSLLLGVAP